MANNTNLLQETLAVLQHNGKTHKDVRWIGNSLIKTDWVNFEKIADVFYDSGYGGNEVSNDLLIVGDDWWLERGEYDGSEWYSFKTMPKEPKVKIELKTVIVQDCINDLLSNNDISYDDLKVLERDQKINEISE